MARLHCNACNCANNNNNYCCLSSIYVGGNSTDKAKYTDCDSFINKGSGFTNSTYNPNPEVNITCNAYNCIYNDDNRCTKAHVDISGLNSCSSEGTCCSSFREG